MSKQLSLDLFPVSPSPATRHTHFGLKIPAGIKWTRMLWWWWVDIRISRGERYCNPKCRKSSVRMEMRPDGIVGERDFSEADVAEIDATLHLTPEEIKKLQWILDRTTADQHPWRYYF